MITTAALLSFFCLYYQYILALSLTCSHAHTCILCILYLRCRYSWQYMILDEGHRIKNRSCRLVKELKQIPSTSRLLLTGTPIQVGPYPTLPPLPYPPTSTDTPLPY